MQVRGLPRQLTRGAALGAASCPQQRSGALPRRACGRRLAGDAVSMGRNPEPLSRRVRQRAWSPALVAAVAAMRADYPMWGKAKLVVLLRCEGSGRSPRAPRAAS